MLSGSHAVPNSESDIRLTVRRILPLQAGAGLAVALLSGWLSGRNALVSALAGMLTSVLANLYMMFKMLRPARTPAGALGRLYLGQLIKVAITVAAFVAAAHWPRVSWPALLCAYVVTLVVFWWVPFASAPRPRRGSGTVGQSGSGVEGK